MPHQDFSCADWDMRSKKNKFALGVTLVFLILGIINAFHHEMWRDEIEAWLIAKDSSSPFSILRTLKYFGHPALWFFTLFPLARITPSPQMMQAFHLLIACIAVFLFVRFSPFPRGLKILFAFGYFAFYEYCTICRMYALSVTLLFAFCVFFPKRHSRFLLLGIILFLFAHSSSHALILTIAISIALFFDAVLTKKYKNKISLALGFIIIILGITTSIIQVMPSPDCGIIMGWKTNVDPSRIQGILTAIPRSFIPVSPFTFHFWNKNILDFVPAAMTVKLLMAILILLFSSLLLVRKPAAFLMYFIGTCGLLAFFYMKYSGHVRHHGFLFMIFICSTWISHYSTEASWLFTPLKKISYLMEKSLYKVLAVILSAHFIGGISAASMDYKNVFSQGKATARVIKQKELDELPMIGDVDFIIMTVSGYLGKKIYYPRSKSLGSFVIWNKERLEPLLDHEIAEKAKSFSLREGKDCLIILNRPLGEKLIRNYSLKTLGHSGRAIVSNEVYFLYIFLKKD